MTNDRLDVKQAGVAVTSGAVGATVATYLTVPLVSALGFKAGGVAGGSFAAKLMTLYGGTIAKGSVVSLLQSAGALGTLSVCTTVGIALGGAAMAGGAVCCGYELYKCYHESNSHKNSVSSYFQALNKYKNYVYEGIKSKV
jgi:hypothetical protein